MGVGVCVCACTCVCILLFSQNAVVTASLQLSMRLCVLIFCREADPRLADIFVKKGPFLKMYTSYIREFQSMVTLLDETCHKNPDFAKIVTDFEVDTNQILLVKFCLILLMFFFKP